MSTRSKDREGAQSGTDGDKVSEEVEWTEGPLLYFEEALEQFQAAVTDARRSQLEWIEAIGPPPGWKKLGPEDLRPSGVDDSAKEGDTEFMSELTRDELKTHLENQNLRVDLRLQSFEQTVRDAMGEIRLEVSGMRGDLKTVEADLGHLKDLRSSIRNTSFAMVSVIAASALAIYFGIQSSNANLVSNTIAGFGAGRDIATVQAEISQQAKETQAILIQIRDEQQKQK